MSKKLLIGTSLSLCLGELVRGEVKLEDVDLILASTKHPDLESAIQKELKHYNPPFSPDGVREILLQSPASRQLLLWALGAGSNSEPIRLTPVMANKKQEFAPASQWLVQGTADFDGDGQVDLLARDSATGAMVVWRLLGSTVVSTHPLAAVPSNPAWTIGGVIEGPTPGTTRIVAQNRVNRRILTWNLNGFTLAGSQYLLNGAGSYVVLPAGSNLVGLRRFTDDASLSLLVRSTAGKVDRWQLDPTGRYQRGSGVTPDSRGSQLPRPD